MIDALPQGPWIYPAIVSTFGLTAGIVVASLFRRWEYVLPVFGWVWIVGSFLFGAAPFWVGLAIAGWSSVFFVLAHREARTAVMEIIGTENVVIGLVTAVVFLVIWWFLAPVVSDWMGLSRWATFRLGVVIIATIPPFAIFLIGVMLVALGLPSTLRGVCEPSEGQDR